MTPHAPGFFVGKNMLKKRLLTLLLIIPFLVNNIDRPSVVQGAPMESHVEITAQQVDKRAQVLQAYLAQFNSPLQYQAQNFIEAADVYGLDWKLVAAIAGVESTFGKFIPGGTGSYTSFNAWGWGVYGDQAIYFRSWKEGIYTVSQGLRSNYLNRGLTDPYSINRAYSTSPAWGWKVDYFLHEIERFNASYNDGFILQAIKPDTNIAGTSALLASR